MFYKKTAISLIRKDLSLFQDIKIFRSQEAIKHGFKPENISVIQKQPTENLTEEEIKNKSPTPLRTNLNPYSPV